MYSITVKIDDIEKRRRNAGILHILIGFLLIIKTADYYRLIEYRNFLPVLPMLLIGSLSLFYGIFRKRIDRSFRYNFLLRLLQLICFTYLGIIVVNVGRSIEYIGNFIFAFLSLILLFNEKRIFQETTIFLDDQGVMIPGSYKDHLVKWDELTEVVVREDFITFFHIRQKYLQYKVNQDLSTLEVTKMNAYCKEKIELAALAETREN